MGKIFLKAGNPGGKLRNLHVLLNFFLKCSFGFFGNLEVFVRLSLHLEFKRHQKNVNLLIGM